MKIQIRTKGFTLGKALRAHVERRVGLALGRFADRIGVVVVRLSDGGDKRCEIEAAFRPKKVLVEDSNTSLVAAVDHATSRASRSIARALERERRSQGGA
jgi:putative sigma-54 modulation protein